MPQFEPVLGETYSIGFAGFSYTIVNPETSRAPFPINLDMWGERYNRTGEFLGWATIELLERYGLVLKPKRELTPFAKFMKEIDERNTPAMPLS